MTTEAAIFELVDEWAHQLWIALMVVLAAATYLYHLCRKVLREGALKVSAEGARGGTEPLLQQQDARRVDPRLSTVRREMSGAVDVELGSPGGDGSPEPRKNEGSAADVGGTPAAADATGGTPSASVVSSSRGGSAARASPTAPASESGQEDITRVFSQAGFRYSLSGSALKAFWMLVPIVSQLHLGWIAFDRHFVRGPDAVAQVSWGHGMVLLIAHVSLAILCGAVSPVALRTFFMQPCSLFDADAVLIREEDEEQSIPKVDGAGPFSCMSVLTPPPQGVRESLLPVVRSGAHFVEYTCVRYLWSRTSQRFRPVGTATSSGAGAHQLFLRGGRNGRIVTDLQSTIGANYVNIEVPGLWGALRDEFCDPIYVLQLFCIWAHVLGQRRQIALFWLLVVLLTGLYRSLKYGRWCRQAVTDMLRLSCQQVERVYRESQWVEVPAWQLVLGDIVEVGLGTLTADLALIAGEAVTNESTLSGSPEAVRKMAVRSTDPTLLTIKAHGRPHLLLCGTEVLQSTRDESGAGLEESLALGIVVGVGGRTLQAQMVRMLLFPSSSTFKRHEDLPKLALLAFAFFCFGVGLNRSLADSPRALTCVMWLLHPLMPAALLMSQCASARRLANLASTASLDLGRIPVAGKVAAMIFDKTGTLTRSEMSLSLVRPVEEGEGLGPARFGDDVSSRALNESDELADGPLLLAIAGCHSVVQQSDGKLVGSPEELQMVNATAWRLPRPFAARRTIQALDNSEQLVVMRQLPFDHEKMTSGVVVLAKSKSKLYVFVKGAWEVIQKMVVQESLPEDYGEVREAEVLECSNYVMAMAYKELPRTMAAETIESMPREELEAGLRLQGLLIFRNEMKPDTPAAITQIKAMGICCLICTGDSVAAGVSVGRRSGIIAPQARVVVGDVVDAGSKVVWLDHMGEAVDPQARFHTSTELALTRDAFRLLLARGGPAAMEAILPQVKVFGRMTPSDKVEVVRLWQTFRGKGLVTAMVGDGANDCAALRAAHVGIAMAISKAPTSGIAAFSSRFGLTKKGYVSILCAAELVREGRACLSTSLSMHMLFATYGLARACASLVMWAWLGAAFSDWQFWSLDIGVGVAVAWAMTGSGPARMLTPHRPCASFLGPRVVLCGVFVVVMHIVLSVIILAELFFGSGKQFLELTYMDILRYWHPVPTDMEENFRSDNYIVSTMFIAILTTSLCISWLFSSGHVFRGSSLANWRLAFVNVALLASIIIFVWAPPNDFGCLFRVGCDNPTSRDLDIPWLRSLTSVGSGSCFLSPDLVQCRTSNRGLCWMAPPQELDISLTYAPATVPRATPPFRTLAEKKDYCARFPYQASPTTPGNLWCFYPQLETNNCEPSPRRVDDTHPVTKCHGPNNCFSTDFKLRLSIILSVYCAIVIFIYHNVFLSRFSFMLMPPSLAVSTFKRSEAANEIELSEMGATSSGSTHTGQTLS